MKVLIPVDGSDSSMSTLEWACKTLDKQNTEFYLLHVIPQNIPELVTETYEVEDALKMLDKAQKMIENCGGKVASAKYLEGDPVSCICQYADEQNLDQVLMGSHGRSGIMKALLGSISSGVMEHCKKPVFIYKNAAKKGAAVS